MKRSIIIAVSIASASFIWVFLGLLSEKQTTPSKPNISLKKTTYKVRVNEFYAQNKSRVLTLFGRTESNRKLNFRVETNGRIESLFNKKGDYVKKGSVIAQLAYDDRSAKYLDASSSVKHFKLAYEAARKLSKKAFRSRVQLAAAKAKLDKAKAILASINLDIKRTRIKVPFNGVLSHLGIEVGSYVDKNTIIGTLVDLDPIIVVGEVNENRRSLLRINTEVLVSLETGKKYRGIIRYISKVGVLKTRTFKIEVEIKNKSTELVEGLTAELQIPTTKVRAHLISPAILTLSKNGVLGVKAVTNEQIVHFYPVKIVSDTNQGVWVVGLPEQVTLITVGQEYVVEGHSVKTIYEKNSPKKQSKNKKINLFSGAT